MRIGLGLVVVMVACDGGHDIPLDAAVDVADSGTDAPAVAPGIIGTWRDTYITASGSMALSSCSVAPAAIVIDETTGAVTPYSGACNSDGSFKIKTTEDLGTYYLNVKGSLYETSKSDGIDLSTDRLGRNDITAVSNAKLALDMTDLSAWSSSDMLVAFASNIGFSQNLSFATGGPTNGGTALTGTASWYGYKLDAAKSDALQIVQLGSHTANTIPYQSLDRVYDVGSFTMADNGTQTINGAFTTPTQGSLTLNVDVASFHQHAAATNPNVATKTIIGTAYAAASAEVIPSPALLAFARDSSTSSTLSLGTVNYGDPFPSGWQRYVKIQEAFAVPYAWNNATGTFTAQVTRVMTTTEAEAGMIEARLSPPQNPKFGTTSAFTATNISPVPVLSWTAPAVGTATDYEITVYEARQNGATLVFEKTLRLSTKKTSLRIPAGYLLGQRQYVFQIRARMRDNVDMYARPLRSGASTSSADTLTALVTIDS